MKYSKATNYALHTMLHLLAAPDGETTGVQPLAEMQGISPTYLSKILSKLVKANLIESTTGLNGGYRLLGQKEDISFLAVIQAIEGTASIFNCNLKHNISACLVKKTMADSERIMEQYLQEQKLVDLIKNMDQTKLSAITNTHS